MRKFWMPPKKRMPTKRVRFVTYDSIQDIPMRYLLQCHKLTLGPSGMMQDYTYEELNRRDGRNVHPYGWYGKIGPVTLCIYRSPRHIRKKQPDTVLTWMLLDSDGHVQMFTHKQYRKKGLAYSTAVRWLKHVRPVDRSDVGTYNNRAWKTLITAKLQGLPRKMRDKTYIRKPWDSF